jgi:hypothetical protein
MKTLDRKTAGIMHAILAAGRTIIDNSGGIYPPVHVSASRWRGGFRIISISQHDAWGGGSPSAAYGTTMLFLHKKDTEEYIPFSYRNGLAGIETCSIAIHKGVPAVTDAGLQEDHTAFASMWLRDISFKHWLGR